MNKLFYFIKVLLLLVVVLVNGAIAGFVFYTEKHNDCECGPAWRRRVIKFGATIIGSLSVVAYFTPIVSVVQAIPLIGGIFLLGVFGLCILMIYCIQQFLKDVQSNECACAEKNKLGQINNVIGPLGITTLAIIALGIVVILFYLL
jgi:hypothetical protein